MPPPRRKPKYRLVIFDMDGTLTEERIDFPAIRQHIGVPENLGILEHIASLAGDAFTQARAILRQYEVQAAQSCTLYEGAHEVLAGLKERRVHRALLTRNSTECTAHVLKRHNLILDLVSTRDQPPHKPHPESVLTICRFFEVSPEQTLMVGDYLYDLQAAIAAGTPSALLYRKPGEWPDFARMATYCLRHLNEVLDLVDGQHAGVIV